MSLETEYNPEKALIARDLFGAMNALATTPRGQWLLAQANLYGLVARGSAGGLLAGQSPLFIRSICDIDLRVYSSNSGYHNDSITSILRFVSLAAKHVGLKLNVTGRKDTGSRLRHRALRHFFPRLDIRIEEQGSGRFIMGMQISLINAPPPPLDQTDFIKAEHPLLRLAEKIRTLHNTSRTLGISTGIDDQKIRRGLDLLDTYQCYHVALNALGSHKAVVDGLKEIYGASMFSHFNRRTTFSILNQNLQKGFFYSDVRDFDDAVDMRKYLPQLVQRMERGGMITVYEPLNASVVLATAYDLMEVMPLPVSKALLKIGRPLRAIKRAINPPRLQR